MFQSINTYVLLALLLLGYQLQSVHAMDGDGESKNNFSFTGQTLRAQDEENNGRPYTSNEGLNYKRKRRIGKRVEHILLHFNNIPEKANHAYFSRDIELHRDPITLIDTIFAHVTSVDDRSHNIPVGNILLADREYNIVKNYDGNEHQYTIKPAGPVDGYPVTGHGQGSSNRYGYTLRIQSKDVNTFFPS